eukprot:SAG25_NODE_1315_length_3305_cov_1.843731_2_plen_115_part_00
MEASIDSFSRNYASQFIGAEGTAGEQRLEWTQAHRDFQELFEHQLETFVSTQSFTQADFVHACQDALDHGAAGATVAASLVEMVLMTGEYEFFVQMMTAAAAAAAEAAGDEGVE